MRSIAYACTRIEAVFLAMTNSNAEHTSSATLRERLRIAAEPVVVEQPRGFPTRHWGNEMV
jgi:hypothetical protein